MLRLLWRRTLLPLVVVVQVALGIHAAAARDRHAVEGAPSVVLQALVVWLDAVDAHQPGVRDEALARVSRWSGWDLGALWIEGLEPLLRACKRPVRVRSLAGIAIPRPRPRPNEAELAFVRSLALGLIRRGAVDRVLRGGALLHGDIAMMASPDPDTGTLPSERPPGPDFPVDSGAAVSMLADGTQAFVPDSTAAHWAMARVLLAQVGAGPSSPDPAPASDPLVRAWYRSTLAWMAALPYIDTKHFDEAEALFPDDALVHLPIGAMHEWMASDTVQRATDAARRRRARPPGAGPGSSPRFPVGSTPDELDKARRHLERAARLDPTLTEAHVRLGRVLGLVGDHTNAVAELRQAVAAEPEPLLAYVGNLFLGAEEEALGRLGAARVAYQRAASLYPRAPTPPLALSHLMRREGNRDEALRLIHEVLAPRPEQAEYTDPMRRYTRIAGRHAKSMLRDMMRLYGESAHVSEGRGTDTVK